jgi:hypothetical protein
MVIQKTAQSAINPKPIRSTFNFATTSIDAPLVYFPQMRFFRRAQITLGNKSPASPAGPRLFFVAFVSFC